MEAAHNRGECKWGPWFISCSEGVSSAVAARDDFRPQAMELWQSEALRILFVQARWMPQQHGCSGFGYTAVPVARIYVPLMSLFQTVQGDDCPYCHLCRKGEIKRRKRKKIKELKAK